MKNFEMGVSECLKPIAYWLRSNSPPGASILSPDIGIVGYVSERNVYDTAGLVSLEVKRSFQGISYDEGMRQGIYERAVHPDYVIDRSTMPQRLASDTLRPMMTRTFSGLGLTHPELTYYTLYKVVK
jgi:hypothetical protein